MHMNGDARDKYVRNKNKPPFHFDSHTFNSSITVYMHLLTGFRAHLMLPIQPKYIHLQNCSWMSGLTVVQLYVSEKEHILEHTFFWHL